MRSRAVESLTSRGRAGKKVLAVPIPEKVDMETDARDNITVDMKNQANEYEFQKLNADFDRKLGRLRGAYKRKADEIFRADQYGLNMEKRGNRLWMWFDRKTKFRIFPKILLAAMALTVSAIVCYYSSASFRDLFGDKGPNDFLGIFLLVPLLMAEIFCYIAIFSSRRQGEDNPFQMSIDLVTNPAWKNLECNVYHEKHENRQ